MIFKLLSALCIFGAVGCAADPPPAKPNFVIVLIDDLGWGDFSCFGNKDGRTPNIDRLAAEGGRFSQFYVGAPICSPSRCAFITGQYPQRWKITSFLNNRADNARRGVADWLNPEAPTLPRMLKSAGYATGHFGKWHLGGQRDVTNAPPLTAYGFDESLTNFEGMGPKLLPLTLQPGDKLPGRIWEDGEKLGKPFTWMQRSEITGGYVSAATKFMNNAAEAGKPFYVNVWPDDVHTPLWPPINNWKEGKRKKYLAVLENMDRQLGVLFDHIRNSPKLRDHTFILVCSDNGPEPGAGSAGPFRGCKGSLYEGGIRSPLIVWGPSLIPNGKAGFFDQESVIAAIDIVPSLLKLAGTPTSPAGRFDGVDESDSLTGKAVVKRATPLFWRRPPDRKIMPGADLGPLPDLAAREGNWKVFCDYEGNHAELYQLLDDPGEKTNVAQQHPDIASRLIKGLLAWHASLPPDNGPALGTEGDK